MQGQGQHSPRIDGETKAQAEERSEPQGLQQERGQESSQTGCRGARSSCPLPAAPRPPPAPGPGTPRWLSTCPSPRAPGVAWTLTAALVLMAVTQGCTAHPTDPSSSPTSAQGACRPPLSSPQPPCSSGARGSPGPCSTSSPCVPPSVIWLSPHPRPFPGKLFERKQAERE